MCNIFNLSIHFFTTFLIGFYLISVLQWYNYRLNRIIFHFHKKIWHIFYFLLPIVIYAISYNYFWIYFLGVYIPSFIMWIRKTKKPLTLTTRVKRFFIILLLVEVLNLYFLCKLNYNLALSLLIVLGLALIFSNITEYIIFLKYKSMAKSRLKKINPKIITITASYGKTSIKNFVYELLSQKFKTYKTPRSINTLKGIILDINTSLPTDTEIYITEAGAREKGDIKEIVEFLENEYSILGKVGPQHIEYFKTLENIKNTKLEVFASSKLKKGFSYDIPFNEKVKVIRDKISNIKATLDGTEWDLEIGGKVYNFKTKILGDFNAINISLAIYQAYEFIKDIEYLKKRVLNLKPIPHRLQKIEVGGKIIIDDSFNGNIEGMLKSFELIKNYSGRKVIVTPGLVEASEEMNKKIAQKIDEIFDLVIITGEVNKNILYNNIINTKKIYVENKSNLEKVLSSFTKKGDLIIFSNDTPDYL